MEQSQYWMWMKRKHDYLREEEAFAEDVVGCIWPPRCYSCSFCNREFKSAQALGGHMNVHRRDRAIMKLSTNNLHSSPQLLIHSFNHILSPEDNSPRLLMNGHNMSQEILLTSRVSATPEESRASPNVSCLKSNKCKNDEYEKSDLSVNLSLVVCRSEANGCVDEDLNLGCKKRRRIDAPSSFTSLMPKSELEFRCHVGVEEALNVNPNHLEDLDLELRLGDTPKVK